MTHIDPFLGPDPNRSPLSIIRVNTSANLPRWSMEALPDPRRFRPSNTVTQPKLDSKQCKIARANNATKSTLLRLPPELRNRIYELVLCAKTIHVFKHPYTRNGMRVTVCRSNKDDDQNYGIVTSHPATFSAFSYSYLHEPSCAFDDRARTRRFATNLDVALLQTCSQIYGEAALLPFTNTTFSFYSDADVSPFIARLVPAQAQAIQKILLANAGSYDFVSDNVWEKLTGLRKLRIVFPVPSFVSVWCPRSTLHNLATCELRTATGRMRFECFQRLNLESFEINVMACYPPVFMEADFARFQLLMKEVEKEVLKGRQGPSEEASPKASLESILSRFVQDKRTCGRLARLLAIFGLRDTRLGWLLLGAKERIFAPFKKAWRLSEG